MFPILTFVPQFKSVIWGGARITSFKGLPPQGDTIGESWELSGVPGHESIVADGPYKGDSLRDLLASNGKEILGERLSARYATEFPLLIKFIDSADDLSVQVHPDDALAAKRHQCPGKTEMWISVDPAPDAYLYAGLTSHITPDEYRARIAGNTIIDVLGKFYPAKGDVFFLPAGRVHSIGKGNFVLEIQETSDITYRIYDFDRRDAQGNPRQLHVEESVEAVDFNDTGSAAPTSIPTDTNTEHVIADCSHFTTTSIDVDGSVALDLKPRDSFSIAVAVDGDLTITAPDGTTTHLPKGHTALIPASMPEVTVAGKGRLITAYIR